MVLDARIIDIPNLSPMFLLKNPTILMFWTICSKCKQTYGVMSGPHPLAKWSAVGRVYGLNLLMEGCFGYVKQFLPIVVVTPTC